jgi:hypothetical protein
MMFQYLRVLRVLPVLFLWDPGRNRKPYKPSTSRCRVMTALLSRTSDPLVHHGRHFGRTVHAMCNVSALVTNGILLMGQDSDVSEESLTTQ